MPKTKISEYSATANSNTDVASINIDEGCAPSGINNAIRAVMGHLKDFQAGTNSDSFNGPTNGAHNGTVGATTPAAGSFTTLSATGNVTLGDAAADTVTVNGTTNFVAAPTIGGVGLGMGFKNRIINGAMVIDQRNSGALVSAPDSGQYLVDRFWYRATNLSKASARQNYNSVTPPAGFVNYLGIVSSSAYSLLTTDRFNIAQNIEGLNVADLGWGAAGAATITLSFQVYSSLTGTFGGALQNSAGDRSYPFTYTISSANTWTSVSVTIAGDTSGTWLKTNGTGVAIYWGLGCGSSTSGTAGAWASAGYFSATGAVSVVSTNAATFYITGVQLEKGSTATSFDYRPYGTELQLCQRYCQKLSDTSSVYQRFASGFCSATTVMDATVPLKVSMRATPGLTTTGTAANYAAYSGAGTLTTGSAVPVLNGTGSNSDIANVQLSVASGLTAGQGGFLIANNSTSAYLLFTAEL